MSGEMETVLPDSNSAETDEWREAIESVVEEDGPQRARYLLARTVEHARRLNVRMPAFTQTPYVNTIPPDREPPFPGDLQMERRIRRIVRWNAMAMVTRANKHHPGIGGHLGTYASAASLYEVGFNHFFRGRDAPGGADHVFVQGHAAPGIYARAFLEGRLGEEQLEHFRRESSGRGLSSYPHPRTMPSFWEYPTVSMGLGPMAAVYQARFNRYLHDRGLADTSQRRVWCFVGDGEMDEPEARGAPGVAAREGLDNLVFVVNCNLQRLDGPVRGNGKIIQELEALFRGAGWNVVKVVWAEDWDPLLARDLDGLLVQRMNEALDGDYQKYSVESGAYIRQHFFGKYPTLLKIVEHLSDEELQKLRRGGHSYRKVYAAYRMATEHAGAPVAILAKTVKGWTLGEGYEASNVIHQLKKMEVSALRRFRDLLQLPIPDASIAETPYYHPGADSPEVRYLRERRASLGGFVPSRRVIVSPVRAPESGPWEEFAAGSRTEVSTTTAFVRLLRNLLHDKALGRYVVPIVPDEARTFGIDALFSELGIYAPGGQKYEPVDSRMLLKYREDRRGQILEEGITEAGSMASFQAAGTALAAHGVPTVPFFLFYSMFGFQRVGDMIWAASDARARGFLLGCTAGRTTLAGEGLQHMDGHSQLAAMAVPSLRAYDPAYAYEVAAIVRHGLRRMLDEDADDTYYITLYNETYPMPPMPEGAEDGIVRGVHLVAPAPEASRPIVQILGSGPLLRCALRARELLSERFGVSAEVWSATSWQQLFRDGRAVERWNRFHPEALPRVPYVAQVLEGHDGPVVAVSDWVEELPSLAARFIPRRFVPLGTDGFGLSDTREALRRHFEVSAPYVVVAALSALRAEGRVDAATVARGIREMDVDPEKPDPAGV